jgi:triosephosphate isomerase
MIFIANLKMMLTADQVVAHFQKHRVEYERLAQQATIVICPTITALRELRSMFNPPLHLGAQTCSAYTLGAYTGEISAQDLAECNTTYCLVGHSERRTLCGETDEHVAVKCLQLHNHKITAVICIGETAAQRTTGQTETVLASQLKPVLEAYNAAQGQKTALIAYEPVWAIGTGNVPTAIELAATFEFLHSFISSAAPQLSFKLLYGGSVASKNAQMFDQVAHLSGFLIGKASLDFQEFKKIVDYFHCPSSN